MAGIALTRVLGGVRLKWPNDIFVGDVKAGGILVERSSEVMVVGLGLNLWWAAPREGMGAIFAEDPGPERHRSIGGLWGAEMLGLIEEESWPIDEYRSRSVTLGKSITWEPAGQGIAVDVGGDGGLVVEVSGGAQKTIYSGAVAHVRT
jgi:BirA family biotin operon repressor/biotin-[acetyl-CoA-carboxylase] ligase